MTQSTAHATYFLFVSSGLTELGRLMRVASSKSLSDLSLCTPLSNLGSGQLKETY